jgi:hypothetical protein
MWVPEAASQLGYYINLTKRSSIRSCRQMNTTGYHQVTGPDKASLANYNKAYS